MRFALIYIVVLSVLMALGTSCSSIDNDRLPPANVNIIFWTQSDWVIHGVSGAGQYKEFIREKKIPSNFPYTAQTYTGVGGTLLCTTYAGTPVAYDLACPVECKGDVRVFVNSGGYAECPVCHSQYDIYSLMGHPISGTAAGRGYGLEIRSVGPGSNGEYVVVRRSY